MQIPFSELAAFVTFALSGKLICSSTTHKENKSSRENAALDQQQPHLKSQTLENLIDDNTRSAFLGLGVDLTQLNLQFVCDKDTNYTKEAKLINEDSLPKFPNIKASKRGRLKKKNSDYFCLESRQFCDSAETSPNIAGVEMEDEATSLTFDINKKELAEEEHFNAADAYQFEQFASIEDTERACLNLGVLPLPVDISSNNGDKNFEATVIPMTDQHSLDGSKSQPVRNKRQGTKNKQVPSNLMLIRKALKRRHRGNHKELFHFPILGERDPNAKYQCTRCIKGFKSDQSLRQHLRRHEEPNQERAWFCFVCTDDVGFKHYDDLKVHHQIRHEKRKLTCPICGKIYDSQHEKRYNSHVNEHENPSKHLFCVGCGENFLTKGLLDAHMKQLGPYHDGRCAICEGVKFDHWQDYRSHVRSEHAGDFKFKCGWCSTILESEALRKCHIREKHHGTGVMSTWKRNNKHKDASTKVSGKGCGGVFCETCGKTIRSGRTSYIYHMEDVHGNEDLACNDCHSVYRFKHANSLKRHIEKCHVKYTCDLCGVQGPRRMYDKHMLSFHTPDHLKPFQCTTCDPPKGFAVKQSLRDHMNTHTGMKPYKCKQCEAAFNSSGNLAAHKRSVHLGIKRPPK